MPVVSNVDAFIPSRLFFGVFGIVFNLNAEKFILINTIVNNCFEGISIFKFLLKNNCYLMFSSFIDGY